MTTDLIEEPETIPMTTPVESTGDPESIVDDEDHAIARAESEGMTGVSPPQVAKASEDPDIRLAIELKMVDLFAEQAKGRKLAEAETKAKKLHNDAKKALEVQVERIQECIDELEVLYRNEPDPEKFPLFDRDKTKADIDASFPKPEAIQPLPAETLEEHLRRRQNETPLADLRLKKGLMEALKHLDFTDVGKIVRGFDAVSFAWDKPNAIKGMSAIRLEQLAEAITEHAAAVKVEWEGIGVTQDGEEIDESMDDPEIDADEETF